MRRTTRETFWERVSPEPNTGCWLWTGTVNRLGYGMVGVGHAKSMSAHRMAWELVHGSIPPGAHVLHRCDTPLCVSVQHLFLGDHAVNMADKKRKGRVNTAPALKRMAEIRRDRRTA